MKSAEALRIENVVREKFLLMSSRDLAKLIGRSESWVKQFKRDNGLIVPEETSRRWTTEKNALRTSCTPAEDEFIKANYLNHGFKALGKLMGCSETKVRTRMRQLNLEVPAEVIANRVANNRFKQGDVPVTKGKKQTDYMTPDAIERTKATRFKKGGLPPNTKGEFGMITVRRNYKKGTCAKYICIKIGHWEPLNKYNWEKKFGPIPPGNCLRFKDGDTLNCEVENLQLISRKQNYYLNSKAGKSKTPVVPRAEKVGKNLISTIAKTVATIEKEQKKLAKRSAKQRAAQRKKEDRQERWEDRIILKFNNQAGKILRSKAKAKPKPKLNIELRKQEESLRRQQSKELKLAEQAKEKTLLLFKREQEKLALKREKEAQRIAKEKEKIKVLPTRVIDETKLVPLRIDAKTVIYIKPDADPEKIRKRFADRHKVSGGFYD